VRDYPTEGKGSTRVELTVGREMAAWRREDGAGSGGPVREREGCARMAGEGENWEGEVKGAQQRCDTLLRRRGREGDGPREVPHGGEEWGVAWGPARW
jgi:hypothetical protein